MSRVRNFFRCLAASSAVVLLVALSAWLPGDQTRVRAQDSAFALGDVNVRSYAVGPLTMGPGDVAHSRLMLPAVQRSLAKVWVLNSTGELLFMRQYPGPVGQPIATGLPVIQNFVDVSFDLSVDALGNLIYDDGNVTNTIGNLERPDDVSIVVSMQLPAVQRVAEPALRSTWGSLQLSDDRLLHPLILPYVRVP